MVVDLNKSKKLGIKGRNSAESGRQWSEVFQFDIPNPSLHPTKKFAPIASSNQATQNDQNPAFFDVKELAVKQKAVGIVYSFRKLKNC